MTMKLGDGRALIATIRFDVRAGNLELARRWANEAFDPVDGVPWSEVTPKQLETACLAIEVKLEEMGL